ncbi:MAG: prepilin peptidase [Desulfatibacillaceae bacterium]
MAQNLLPYFPHVVALLFGLCIGSFLNVCIHRLPGPESIARGRSHCPNCGTMISAYDNVPVFSYIILGARCRHCKGPISARYPAVELLTGALAVLCVFRFGPTWDAVYYFAFCCALVVVSFVDYDLMIIPDVISLPGIPIGIAGAFFVGMATPVDAVLGAAVGWGLLHAIRIGYQLLRGREGMGLGDVKLLSMIGAFCGVKAVFFTLVAGPMVGLVVGLALMAVRRKGLGLGIPFGPFLALGALLYLFVGDWLILWYAGLFR